MADALLDPAVDIDSPIAIWQVVRTALASGWEPAGPDEASRLLDGTYAGIYVAAERQVLLSPDANWTIAAAVSILRRLARSEPVSLIGALHVLGLNIASHRWLFDHYGGVDGWTQERAQLLDYIARAVMDLEPNDGERYYFDHPVLATALPSTPGQRIIRRRKALGWTQAKLAVEIGVDRSTVGKWESDRRAPYPAMAHALTRCLGGTPSDYR